ncbi:unnamed protein product [Sympodiomycopsis kandeliae]
MNDPLPAQASNLATTLQQGPARSTNDGGSQEYSSKRAAIQTDIRDAALNTTFGRSASISINESVGSMSLSPANRDVVLAARKGLYIVDLESPFAPPRFLAQLSTWEAADVQWSPHPARSHWVASTSNDRLLIWNLDRPEGAPRGPAPLLMSSNPATGKLSGSGSGFVGRSGSLRPQSGTSLTPSMASVGSSPSIGHSFPHLSSDVQSSSSSPRSSAIEHVLQAHTRAITDINFSAHHPDILASCGIDAWSWVWDLRTPNKPVQGYSAWNAGATQIKWNRSTPHRLATAVTNKVLIWDDRKGALPFATIEAHEKQIYGLDWSRDISNAGSNRLVTCSLDGAVKFWDLAAPASQAAIGSRSLVTEPEQIIQTETPIWRARHLPFGRGVMTLPQRGDTTLSMWARDSPEKPVDRFVGHKDDVKEYLFRTRGAQESGSDDRRFQLITWSKDQTLRLWPVSEASMAKVGHDPKAPIRVLQTRKGAKDISYRDPPQHIPTQGAEVGRSERLLEAGGASPETTILTATTAHRSSIMPPSDVTAGLLSGRGTGKTHISGNDATPVAGSNAISPSSGRSTGRQSGFSNTHTAAPNTNLLGAGGSSSNLLSASLQNRLNLLSKSAGESPVMMSKSFPRASTFSKPNPKGGQMQSFGSAATQTPKGNTEKKKFGRSQETRRSGTASSINPPPSAGKKSGRGQGSFTTLQKMQQDRTTKRSKRLAQSAATTYMTRGSGPGLGHELLRFRLGSGGIGTYQSSARRRNDAVTWISGVKVEKQDARARRSKSAETGTGRNLTGLSAVMPTSPGGTLRGRPILNTRGISEQLYEPHTSRGASASKAAADHAADFDLQEEVIDVSKEVPQVTFEKIDIAKRSCTMSLYGPWAHRHEPVYLRLSLKFSQNYPSQPPKFELQHNASCSLQTRAFLLRSISTIVSECASQGRGCMDPCARFLAGSPTIELGDGFLFAAQSAPVAEDSDEDTDAEDRVVPTQMIRMLPGARCGASFGPNGQLVVFKAVKTPPVSRDEPLSRDTALTPLPPLNLPLPAQPMTESNASIAGSVRSVGTGPRPAGGRFLYSYAELTKAMHSLTQMGSNAEVGAGEREADTGAGGRTSRLSDGAAKTQANISPPGPSHLQAPELLSLMSSDFLARRLQARPRSTGTQDNTQKEDDKSKSKQAAHHTTLLSSPLGFTAIERGERAAVTEAPTPVRGRSRDPATAANIPEGGKAADDGAFPNVATALLKGPRSRSLAVGRERQRALAPLVPCATLAHPHACSEVRIYSLDIGDLTLRMARKKPHHHHHHHHHQRSHRHHHHHHDHRQQRDAGSSRTSLSGDGEQEVDRYDEQGDVHSRSRGDSGPREDESEEEEEEDDRVEDDGGSQRAKRPGFWRKRSESSPAAPRLRFR